MAARRPPELMDDVIGEILLRLRPQDPACLVRASLACKPWRRLLTDGNFLQQYRAFHRTPPMLGFFEDQYGNGSWVPKFVPTIQASPVPQPALAVAGSPTISGWTLDCRHGRVLFAAKAQQQQSHRLIVWDPITGNQKCISVPVDPDVEFSAAVLCASDGCDHLGCSGGPFFVVIAGIYIADEEELEEEDDDGDDEDDDEDGDGDAGGDLVAWASCYSSETGVWTASTSINANSISDAGLPSLFVRDAIYFILGNGESILKYSLVGGVLSLIDVPPQHGRNMILASAQDGELGAAIVEGYSLHLWSWRATGPDGGGIGEWARSRVIELDAMIPFSIGDPSTIFDLAGFAEGTDSVFMGANDELYTVELMSGRITKMGKRTSDCPIFPFKSFYTPDFLTARMQVPMRID